MYKKKILLGLSLFSRLALTLNPFISEDNYYHYINNTDVTHISKRHSKCHLPFKRTINNYKPCELWGDIKAPYPTNAWWINMLIGEGKNPIGVHPYIASGYEGGVSFWYPKRDTYNDGVFYTKQDYWNAGTTEGFSGRKILRYDDMSMTFQWVTDEAKSGHMHVPFVKGSPYFSLRYIDAFPQFEYVAGQIIHVKSDPHDKSHEIKLGNGDIWYIFTKNGMPVKFEDGKIKSVNMYSGYVRFAYVSRRLNTHEVNEAYKVLNRHSNVVPVSTDVSFKKGTIIHKYKVNFGENANYLLMLTLPHHHNVLEHPKWVNGLRYFHSIKGPMRPVLGKTWIIKDSQLNKIQFRYPEELPKDSGMVDEIKDALDEEEVGLNPNREDQQVYFVGKKLAKLARLALIADEVGYHSKKNAVLRTIKAALTDWLKSRVNNKLVYDSTWGGVCTFDSLTNHGVDVGNGRYNDHHIHYGYYMYAAAVLLKLSENQKDWYNEHKRALKFIEKDYLNLNKSSRYFPFVRAFDFYDGHSWASGLYEFELNRNLESSSESVNAYYAGYLYALAICDDEKADIFNTLLTSEIRSAQFYWQVMRKSKIYPETFAENHMVGILWDSSAQYTTWFGKKPEYIYGIQMLPFTPITFSLINREWIREAWHTIKERTIVNNPGVSDEWKEFMLMAGALVNKRYARHHLQHIRKHDSGNSKTNALWWISHC